MNALIEETRRPRRTRWQRAAGHGRPTAWLALAGALLGAAGCSGGSARLRPRASDAPPSLLVVTLDTTRADRMGALGHEGAATPTFDRIAREGALFRRAWTTAPLTTPSHASLMTGLLPGAHGVRNNGRLRLPDEAVTLAEVLKGAGYRTGGFVGGYPVGRSFGLAQGFRVFDDDFGTNPDGSLRTERRADEVTARALPWLREVAAGSEPFFAWLHFFDAHAPYSPPGAFAQRFRGREYDGEIAFADDQLGRVMQVLLEAGVLDDTVVVVLADHGEGLGDHGEEGHGVFLYEEAVRIPLAVRAPWAIAPGSVRDDPASILDVTPTCLSLLGRPVPPGLHGRDLTRDPAAPSGAPGPLAAGGEHRVLVAESLYGREEYSWAALFALRRGDDKWIAAPRRERYDLAADPGERQNLAYRDRDLDAELDALLQEALVTAEAATLGEESVSDEAALEALRSLGYVGGGGTGSARSGLATGRDPKEAVDDLRTYLEAVRRMTQGGECAAAKDLLEPLVVRDPANPEFRMRLADARQCLGDLAGAEQTYRQLIVDYPGFYLPYRHLSTLLERQGRHAENVDLWRVASGRGLGFVGIPARLAGAQLLAGRPSEALATCDAELGAGGDDPVLLSISGVALQRLDRPEDAWDRYERALELRAGYAEALEPLVALADELDRKDEALAIVRDSARRLPGHAGLEAMVLELTTASEVSP